jgi:hypothetical protein
MRLRAETFKAGPRRSGAWLRSAGRWFDVDLQAARADRQYELRACAMAPELVSLAALIVLAEDDPPATDRALFSR